MTISSTQARTETTLRKEKQITIYLAGPLFNIAERCHNWRLGWKLREMGYIVISPQEEALRFFDGQKFNLDGIRINCKEQAIYSDVVVANIDGTDADSGTALEVGLALIGKSNTIKPFVICVRTDFRTDMAKEIGVNGMFGLADRIIYKPAFVISFEEIEKFYRELAQEIDDAIKSLKASRLAH